MNFREYLSFLEREGLLQEIHGAPSPDLEIASIIHEHDGKAVKFPRVQGHDIPVVSGLFGNRAAFDLATTPGDVDASLFKAAGARIKPLPAIDPRSFIFKLHEAITTRHAPAIHDSAVIAPCQEVIEPPSFLSELPILKHLPGDGGKYITSGVVIYTCPKHGRNVSFHRMMVTGDDAMVARVVENRGLDTALHEKKGPLDAAIVIGSAPHVMVAASTSVPKGIDELSIANVISPFEVVQCKTVDVQVPSDSEIVIEGQFLPDLAPEGPFLDLTGTFDIVRKQPSFRVTCITHRRDPVYHALLPAGMEHELLMGLPREATMLMELRKFGNVKDVRLTPGSSHWFNAVVQVDRRLPVSAFDLVQACFQGHSSLKHCVVVDDDIDIDDPRDIEFAMTTRCQLDKRLRLYPGERGSSLDPSADQVTRATCKAGIDATMPRDVDASSYEKQRYGGGGPSCT